MYIAPSTERLVRAYCGEYIRMRTAVKSGTLTPYMTSKYTDTANAIYSAVERTSNLRGCQVDELIYNISNQTGYHDTQLRFAIGKNRYYRAKKIAIYQIAQNLRLI